jgi:arabinofuranosyltransferase
MAAAPAVLGDRLISLRRELGGPERSGRGALRSRLQHAVLAVPVVWVVAVGWAHRFMTEDGFIYLRVVQQVRAGNGAVFNAGERVEAFTGTLWVAVLSVADLVTPVRLEWLAVVLGLAATAGGVALSLGGARRLWGELAGTPFFVPFGAVVFVAVFPLWAYATGGLETGLVFGWLGACFWILVTWATRGGRVPVAGAVVLGLGWLVRPEMVLYSAAFVTVVVVVQWRHDGWRDRATFLAAALALPVAYQVFRMGYYGSLVANTAIAKEGGETGWGRGTRYLRDFTGPYWLWVPGVGVVAGGYVPLVSFLARARHRRRAAVVATFVACGAMNVLYVVAVGGDYHHGRMFLPPLFALCAPVAVVPAARRQVVGLVVAAWALAAVVCLRPDQHDGDNWLANGFLAPREFGLVTTDDHGWGSSGPPRTWYSGPGYYYEAGTLDYRRADMALQTDLDLPFGAFWGVGVSGYALGSDFNVLDQLGLADSFTAHLGREPSLHPELPRFPGHEKPLPSPWLAARVTPEGTRPDPGVFPPFFQNPLIPVTTGDEFQEQVAWARAALECDAIDDVLDSAEASLSVGGFLANVGRSFEQTFLRIPADPETAYHRFCGPGTPPEVRSVRAASEPTS